METKELLARFKKFQQGALILMGVTLIVNIVMLGFAISRLNRIYDRLPISVSCSGSSSYTPPPDGILSSSLEPDFDLASRGETAVVASFRVAAKVPGSTVLLAYRCGEEQEWRRTLMTSSVEEPMVFTASVPVDLSHPDFEYRLEQALDGEVVHASRSEKQSVRYLLGGSGEICIDYFVPFNSKQGRITVYSAYARPVVQAYAIAEVTLKINKTKPEVVTLEPEPGERSVSYSFDPDGLKDIEVTVIYKDGEVRKTVFNPFAPRPEEGIYITR